MLPISDIKVGFHYILKHDKFKEYYIKHIKITNIVHKQTLSVNVKELLEYFFLSIDQLVGR